MQRKKQRIKYLEDYRDKKVMRVTLTEDEILVI